ncbi:hypothetical protein VK70_13325 [Paenibacillus durus ATCC 35681]|uniref:Uncharacterized protein n=1 Tax=Paenibacillus durus ATCC 35681 TaxID=1333534 RepID=A0A0F7FA89_PAEDU|nr:hypothetical protein VK70_13325 [Paenibacillus durus ATCC 35681]
MQMETLLRADLPQGRLDCKARCLFLRVKVRIVCKQCGESYILRGIKYHGIIQTGFKQCLCNCTEGFLIEEQV